MPVWASARRVLLLWAMLFAITWQGFVTQTHRHLQPAASFTQGTIWEGKQQPDRQQPLESPANCWICREIAAAGPALLPVAIALDVPEARAFWIAPSQRPGLAPQTRTHLWRSRAPPLSLQA